MQLNKLKVKSKKLKDDTSEKDLGGKGQGLVIAFYGDGKGKTSAAIGTAVRSISMGRKVAFLQFVKGDWTTNEEKFFQKTDGVLFEKLGEGFVNENSEKHIQACKSATKRAERILKSDYDLIVLDELLTAFELGLVELDDLEKILKTRKKGCDLVLTGRKLPDGIISKCDIITHMKKKRHIFDKGILAKNGIDF